MPDELLNVNSVPLRVLREHFPHLDKGDARDIIEAVAKERRIPCTDYLDACTIFEERGELPDFVVDFCTDVLLKGQQRIRGQNGR